MTPKPRPRKPRDAATLRAVARDLRREAKRWVTPQVGIVLNRQADYYLEQARALEKKL